MKYQTFTVLPFWFKRWILFGWVWNKNAVCPPLYEFDHVASSAAEDLVPSSKTRRDS
jgi:hypothetical protein